MPLQARQQTLIDKISALEEIAANLRGRIGTFDCRQLVLMQAVRRGSLVSVCWSSIEPAEGGEGEATTICFAYLADPPSTASQRKRNCKLSR